MNSESKNRSVIQHPPNCSLQDQSNTHKLSAISQDQFNRIKSKENSFGEVKQEQNQEKGECPLNKMNKTQQLAPNFAHGLLSSQQEDPKFKTQMAIIAQRIILKEQILDLREKAIDLRQVAIVINERRIISKERSIHEKEDSMNLQKQAADLREEQLQKKQLQINQRSENVAFRERMLHLRQIQANQREKKQLSGLIIGQPIQTEAVSDLIIANSEANEIEAVSKRTKRLKAIQKDRVNRAKKGKQHTNKGRPTK